MTVTRQHPQQATPPMALNEHGAEPPKPARLTAVERAPLALQVAAAPRARKMSPQPPPAARAALPVVSAVPPAISAAVDATGTGAPLPPCPPPSIAVNAPDAYERITALLRASHAERTARLDASRVPVSAEQRARERWIAETARDCWHEADGDIEVASKLAVDATETEDEYRAVCAELQEIERRSDAEGWL